jgi:hypothetical protein
MRRAGEVVGVYPELGLGVRAEGVMCCQLYGNILGQLARKCPR